MSKKVLVIGISVALIVLGVFVFTAEASDSVNPSGWRLIWQALRHLQGQIDDLQPSTYEVMSEHQVSPVSPETVFVNCDDGDKVTGGGFEHFGALEILGSRPRSTGGLQAWRVSVTTKDATQGTLRAYAVCLDLPPKRP